MSEQQQSTDLGPWAEWTAGESFDEIYDEPARVIPAPPDDEDE